MNPFVAFALALRVLGAWTLIIATEYACTAYNISTGHDTDSRFDVSAPVNQMVVHLAVGLVLLLLAPALSRLAYPLRVKAGSEGEG